MMHNKMVSHASNRLIQTIFFSSSWFGDAPYLGLWSFPSSLLTLLCLPPFVPSTADNMKSVKDAILLLLPPFRTSTHLCSALLVLFLRLQCLSFMVCVSDEACFLACQWVFFPSPLASICVVICNVVWLFPEFNSLFGCPRAKVFCTVYALWSFYLFPWTKL